MRQHMGMLFCELFYLAFTTIYIGVGPALTQAPTDEALLG